MSILKGRLRKKAFSINLPLDQLRKAEEELSEGKLTLNNLACKFISVISVLKCIRIKISTSMRQVLERSSRTSFRWRPNFLI